MLIFYANQVFSGELEAQELGCLYECFKIKKNKVTLITTDQSYGTYTLFPWLRKLLTCKL